MSPFSFPTGLGDVELRGGAKGEILTLSALDLGIWFTLFNAGSARFLSFVLMSCLVLM